MIATEPEMVRSLHTELTDTTTEPSNAWSIAFLSPATLRSGTQSYPAFEAGRILSGLQSRWNRHVGDVYGSIDVSAALSSVRITDIDGHSVIHRIGGFTVSGFVGHIRYVTADPESAAPVDLLWRLGEFVGVGSYTTRGLGRIRMEPTWKAPLRFDGRPGN